MNINAVFNIDDSSKRNCKEVNTIGFDWLNDNHL